MRNVPMFSIASPPPAASALAHVHDLSISQIEAMEEAALRVYDAHPTMTAARAFGEAVGVRER